MQHSIKVVVISFLCFISLSLFAQKVKEKVSSLEKNNAFKINLSALAFKNISVQYERAVGKRSSVALNLHTIPFGKLPFQNTFKDITNNTDVRYDQFKLGSFGVVPEFRFYVGKRGALHGFYIGPFVSYTTYKMNLPISYTSGTATKTGIFNGNMNAITGGIQFGTQFSLGKNVVLDWWILGPNYGSANGTLTFSAALSNSERDDLQTRLNQLKSDAPLNVIKTATASNTGAVITAKGPWAGLRGLGFNLGFRF